MKINGNFSGNSHLDPFYPLFPDRIGMLWSFVEPEENRSTRSPEKIPRDKVQSLSQRNRYPYPAAGTGNKDHLSWWNTLAEVLVARSSLWIRVTRTLGTRLDKDENQQQLLNPHMRAGSERRGE